MKQKKLMIKVIRIVFLLPMIWVLSCNSNIERLVYMDSSNKYYAKIEESEKKALIDTLFILSDFNEPANVKEAGFIKDGFRNGLWTYNFNPDVKTIKWGYYKDPNLDFETNLFQQIDSRKFGDSYTKFVFNTGSDKVVLSININGPYKDSLPEINYKRLAEDEMVKIGNETIYFRTKKLLNDHNNIYINDIKIKSTATNQIKFIKNVFCSLDKDLFVDYSVVYSEEKNVYANILFDGVLTNLFINDKRLFDPFSPSTVSYPEWSKNQKNSPISK